MTIRNVIYRLATLAALLGYLGFSLYLSAQDYEQRGAFEARSFHQ